MVSGVSSAAENTLVEAANRYPHSNKTEKRVGIPFFLLFLYVTDYSKDYVINKDVSINIFISAY
jgi:hypothetical protein